MANLRLFEEKKRLKTNSSRQLLWTQFLHWILPLSRRAQTNAVKCLLAEEDQDQRHQSLCQLPVQGEMARAWDVSLPDLWVKAIQDLPPDPLKFILNASINTLPTNSNQHRWGKKASDICTLCCVSSQSLEHILNNCSKAMELC